MSCESSSALAALTLAGRQDKKGVTSQGEQGVQVRRAVKDTCCKEPRATQLDRPLSTRIGRNESVVEIYIVAENYITGVCCNATCDL